MRTTLAVAATAATLTLAACGTTEPTTEPAAHTESTSAAGPVTVTDARGKEVTLEAPAERVVALEWGEAEMVATLGVTPVGIADTKGYATWNTAVPMDDSVKDVGTRAEPSIDSIVALDPDLVIAIPDTGKAVIKKLEEYVPVIVTEGTDASRNMERLRSDFTMIATAVGKEDKAQEVLAHMDQTLADGKAAITEAGMAGTPFVMVDGWKQGSTVSIRPFGEGSLVSDIAESMGLENAWKGEVDEAWGLGQTDVEGMTAIDDPDTHLFYSASEQDVFAKDLADNKIWSALPFTTPGQMHKLEPGTWTFGGPKSVESIANQFVAGIAG